MIDDIHFADGGERLGVPGGAGLYALSGAAPFSDHTVLTIGTGEDYCITYGPWMERNGLSTEGLRIADPHTPRNTLRYFPDGERSEEPVYGVAHFRRTEPTAADIRRRVADARGLYVFRDTDPDFWAELAPLLAANPVTTLWEIAANACLPENLPEIERIAGMIDAVSINRQEAAALFQTEDEAALLASLGALPATIFLRAGERGSYWIEADTVGFVPSVPVAPVDVTGGGNAYGGAAMVGLAQGLPAREAAAMGTAAASLAIRQFGPPEAGNPAFRAVARDLVRDLQSTREAVH
ncbi:carbohydrate kinase family protein [Consotaella aegiceratis]|uniref:carbohydrate kinase family protein n=1 Tax=Consotaella aegiceratis TaxID=3097961 RepID=UPI002F420666